MNFFYKKQKRKKRINDDGFPDFDIFLYLKKQSEERGKLSAILKYVIYLYQINSINDKVYDFEITNCCYVFDKL